MDEMIEPLKAYHSRLRDAFAKNTDTFFNDLVKQSGVNVEENRRTVAEYGDTLRKAEEAGKKTSSMKAVKVFVIIVIVLAFVLAAVFLAVGIVGAVNGDTDLLWLWILLTCLLIGLGVGMIFVLTKAVNRALEKRRKKWQELKDKAAALLQKAWGQMAPLNALYHWDMTRRIIDRTTPIVKLDKSFDMSKLEYLHSKYGLGENEDPNRSTVEILSGSIVGNPFIVERELCHRMGSKTYVGSLTVSWTETIQTSDGTKTVVRTQTLTASVTKPYPEYSYRTDLIYGNDAAPDLTFSRSPSGVKGKNEKQIEKFVDRGEKAIRRQEKRAMKAGEDFTAMANTDFEALFGATDRDNETQFRLLFTPLAQQNMVALIKSQAPYGDDFWFSKRRCLNFISSAHSQQWDMNLDPSRYVTYNIDEAYTRFSSFNNAYFCSLYFDLAPLMSIPLYQQQKPVEYIYGREFPKNYTRFEAESIANAFRPAAFLHPESATKGILKANFLGKDGRSDRVRVAAYSYAGIDRVDIVPKRARNGQVYGVPVPWVEYVPRVRETDMELKEFNDVREEYADKLSVESFRKYFSRYTSGDNAVFRRGFLAMLIGSYRYTAQDDEELDRDFRKTSEPTPTEKPDVAGETAPAEPPAQPDPADHENLNKEGE